MGVLKCDREGCTNIMCDRYSHKYGYLCDECFEELIALGVRCNIKDFMNTKKEPNQLDARNRLEEEFFLRKF